MQLPVRSWRHTLSSLGLQWSSSQPCRQKARRHLRTEALEVRQMMTGSPPSIDALVVSPSSLVAGSTLTLTAVNVQDSGGTVQEVDFYRDTNGDGTLETGTDQLIGSAISGTSGNWSITCGTSGHPVGYDSFFAVGVDSAAGPGNVVQAAELVSASSSAVGVNLSSSFNREGLTTDGTAFSGGGLDTGGEALSATQLGSSQTWNGAPFALGSANSNNVVNASGQTISVPAGSYTALQLLATGVNGNQANQQFTVNYSDGSSTTVSQGISDWHTPQSYSGESIVASIAYRNNADGTQQNLSFNVYGYSLAVDSSKTLSSITLPNNADVNVLALTAVNLVAAPTSLTATPDAAGHVGLAWTAATGTVTGYDVYRGTSSGGEALTPLNSSPLPASVLSFQDTSLIATGNYFYVVKAANGTAQSSASNEASISASLPITTISLTSAFNREGLTSDGITFSLGGLDRGGNALSASLLGSGPSWNGVPFALGAADTINVVSGLGQNIDVPAGSYTALELLVAGVNGNQANQEFTVNYSDGSSTTIYQGVSDWHTPQSYPGESIVASMPYRNTADGTKNILSFNVFGYSLGVDSSKTVSSITLPDNTNVNVLALTAVDVVAVAPTALTATLDAADHAHLTWTAAAGTVTGYNIYRGSSNGGEALTPLNSSPLPASTRGYQDASLAWPGNYFYVVKAIDDNAPGLASNEASISLSLPTTTINLDSVFNRDGITTDGTPFSGGGLDTGGETLSANQLGSSQTWNGIPFTLGSADSYNVVSAAAQTIGIPSGSYASLELLATGVNGNQANQQFTVNYGDGSSTTITQGISDWHTPQSYSGESIVKSMSYRNNADGTKQHLSFNVYGYSLAVDSSKTVSSITLPFNSNVALLGITALARPSSTQDGTIQSLSAPASVVQGGPLTLAPAGLVDTGGSVQSVSYYFDNRGSNILDTAHDALLGTATSGADGWSVTIANNSLPAGTATIFAQANLTSGTGNVTATRVNVIAEGTIGSLFVPSAIVQTGSLTVQAQNVADAGNIDGISYYLDTTGSGILDIAHDRLLGTGTRAGNWALTLAHNGLPFGTQTIFARASLPTGSGNVVGLQTFVRQEGNIQALQTSISADDQSFIMQAAGMVDGGDITDVAFYVDSNGNGIIDSNSDQLLGTATAASNYQLTIPLADLPNGVTPILAQAQLTSQALAAGNGPNQVGANAALSTYYVQLGNAPNLNGNAGATESIMQGASAFSESGTATLNKPIVRAMNAVDAVFQAIGFSASGAAGGMFSSSDTSQRGAFDYNGQFKYTIQSGDLHYDATTPSNNGPKGPFEAVAFEDLFGRSGNVIDYNDGYFPVSVTQVAGVSVTATVPITNDKGTTPGQFTIARTTGSTSGDLVISYQLSGTAVNGTHYDMISSTSVTIPAGSPSVTINITPKQQTTVQPDRTVVLTLTQPTGSATNYVVTQSSNSGTVTIQDSQVVGYQLEKQQSDGTWLTVTNDGLFLDTDNLRRTATYSPHTPDAPTSVVWLAKPWQYKDDSSYPWTQFAAGAGFAATQGNPGSGDWAVTPEVTFANGQKGRPVTPRREQLVKIDLEAKVIANNAPTGTLASSIEDTEGAYLPLNNAVNNNGGDNNLMMPIVLHKMPQSDTYGGQYRLTIPDALSIYRTPDKTTIPITFNDTFSASSDTTLYVSGKSVDISMISLNWSSNQYQLPDADRIKVTTFDVIGPLDVPQYSSYLYSADFPAGDQSHSNDSTAWSAGNDGTLVDGGPSNAGGYIHWGAGRATGIATYTASTNYSWDFQVNVVQVSVEREGVFVATPPSDLGTTTKNGVLTKFVSAGDLDWKAHVTLVGPGPDGTKGIDKIKVGFVQTLTSFTSRGLYGADEGQVLESSVASALPLSDPHGVGQWYLDAGTAIFDNANSATPSADISTDDNPRLKMPLTYAQTPAVLADSELLHAWELQSAFTLYVAAQTKDFGIGGNSVYTAEAKTTWTFDASGTIGGSPQFAWSQTGGGVTSPLEWVPSDGEIPLVSTTSANTALLSETWNSG